MENFCTYFPSLSTSEISSIPTDICQKLIETVEQKNISFNNSIFLYKNKIEAYEERIKEENKLKDKMLEEILQLKEEIKELKENKTYDVNINIDSDISEIEEIESDEKLKKKRKKNECSSDINSYKERVEKEDKIQAFFINNIIEYNFLFEELAIPDLNESIESEESTDSSNIEFYKQKIENLLKKINYLLGGGKEDILLKIEYYEDLKIRMASILKNYTERIILLQDVLLSVREYWKIDQETEYHLEREIRKIKVDEIETFERFDINKEEQEKFKSSDGNKKEYYKIENNEIESFEDFDTNKKRNEKEVLKQSDMNKEIPIEKKEILTYKKLLWLSKLENLKLKKLYAILHKKYKEYKINTNNCITQLKSKLTSLSSIENKNECLKSDLNQQKINYNTLLNEYNRAIDYIRSKEHALSALNTKITYMQPIVDRTEETLKERIEIELHLNNKLEEIIQLKRKNEILNNAINKLIDPTSYIYTLQQENNTLKKKITNTKTIKLKIKEKIKNKLPPIENLINNIIEEIENIETINKNIKIIFKESVNNEIKTTEENFNHKTLEYKNIIEDKNNYINQLLNNSNNEIISIITKERTFLQKENEFLKYKLKNKETEKNTLKEINKIPLLKEIKTPEELILKIKDIIEQLNNKIEDKNKIQEIIEDKNKIKTLEEEIKKKQLTIETLKQYVIKLRKTTNTTE